MKKVLSMLVALVTVLAFAVGCAQTPAGPDAALSPTQENTASNGGSKVIEAPQIPKVSVNVGMAPVGDQTWAYIGMKKGFFEDVGITVTPQPSGSIITSDQRTAALIAGTVDIMTGHPGSIAPVHKDAPNLKFFCGSNVFEGYAILTQPNSGNKSFKEFLAEGNDQKTALKKTMEQILGKTYCYSQGSACVSFVESAMNLGQISLNGFDNVPLDDAECLSMMLSGRSDFATMAAPQRAALEAKGYYPIFSGSDLADIAEASPESTMLEGLLVCGWCSTDEYLAKNHDTVLRLCSVFYRTLDIMVNDQATAISIQLPFLNSVSGLNLTADELAVLYNKLNPFYTFEMQSAWYEDPTNIFYYKNELGAKLRSYVRQGIFKEGEIAIEDVSVAPQIYLELKKLKIDSEALISEVKAAQNLSEDTKSLLSQAEHWLSVYNFLDAYRFAEAAKNSI